MIALYIIAGIALLILLLLMLRIRITVAYEKSPSSEGKSAVFLGIGPVKIKLYPKKKRPPKLSDYSAKKYRHLLEAEAEAKAKAKKSSEANTKKKEKNETLPSGLGETFELITELAEKFTGHLRCDIQKLRIKVGTDNAATTALVSSGISAAVSFLIETVDNHTDMHISSPENVYVRPDFDCSEISGDVSVKLSIRIINILRAGSGFIKNYFRTLIRLDKQN